MREIIGCQYVDLMGQDGRKVEGYKLFLRYVDDNVTGDACEAVWARVGSYPPNFTPGVGDYIYVLRNAKGRVQGIVPCAAQ